MSEYIWFVLLNNHYGTWHRYWMIHHPKKTNDGVRILPIRHHYCFHILLCMYCKSWSRLMSILNYRISICVLLYCMRQHSENRMTSESSDLWNRLSSMACSLMAWLWPQSLLLVLLWLVSAPMGSCRHNLKRSQASSQLGKGKIYRHYHILRHKHQRIQFCIYQCTHSVHHGVYQTKEPIYCDYNVS